MELTFVVSLRCALPPIVRFIVRCVVFYYVVATFTFGVAGPPLVDQCCVAPRIPSLAH